MLSKNFHFFNDRLVDSNSGIISLWVVNRVSGLGIFRAKFTKSDNVWLILKVEFGKNVECLRTRNVISREFRKYRH